MASSLLATNEFERLFGPKKPPAIQKSTSEEGPITAKRRSGRTSSEESDTSPPISQSPTPPRAAVLKRKARLGNQKNKYLSASTSLLPTTRNAPASLSPHSMESRSPTSPISSPSSPEDLVPQVALVRRVQSTDSFADYHEEDSGRGLVPLDMSKMMLSDAKPQTQGSSSSSVVAMAKDHFQKQMQQHPEALIAMMCNMQPTQMEHLLGNGAVEAMDIMKHMLYVKLTNVYGLRIYLYNINETIADTEFLKLEYIQGLVNTKTLLSNMLDKNTAKFASICAPEGIGIRTLVKAKCQASSINLIVVDRHFIQDGMLTEVLQFGLLKEPTMIFFDHCEDWFCDQGGGYINMPQTTASNGHVRPSTTPNATTAVPLPAPQSIPQISNPVVYATRGLELLTRLNKYSKIENGTAQLWLLFSFNVEHQRVTYHLRQKISSNFTSEALSYYEKKSLLIVAENCWLKELITMGASQAAKQASISTFRQSYAECFEKYYRLEAFTPNMHMKVVNEIFILARRRAPPFSKQDNSKLLPTMEDVQYVLGVQILGATPGGLLWRGTG